MRLRCSTSSKPDVAFVDEMQHTATGKIQKLKPRERFEPYRLPIA